MTSRLIVIFVISFGISACSSVKIIYSFAGDFIKSEVSYFLDLDENGKVLLNDEVGNLMAWHDSEMLPRYATYLRQQAENLQNDAYGANAIADSMAEARTILEELVAGSARYVARVLVQHTSSKDIDHLRQQMAKRIEIQQEKLNLDLEHRIEERSEKVTENFERFIGDLNEEQTNLIRGYANSTVNEAYKRLDNRILRQSALLNLLNQKPTESEIANFTEQILLRSHQVVDPSYRKFAEAGVNKFTKLLFNVLKHSTNEQRRIATNVLRDYAQDISDLSR